MQRKFKVHVSNLLWTFSFLKPKYLLFAFSCMLGMANAAVTVLTPYLFQNLVDLASDAQSLHITDFFTAFVMIGAMVLSIPVSAVGTKLQRTLTVEAQKKMRRSIFAHLLPIRYDAVQKSIEGKALTIFTQDIDRTSGFMSGFTFGLLVKFAVLFPLSFFVLLSNDWRMLLVGLLLGAVTITVAEILNPIGRKYEKQGLTHTEQANGQILELLNGYTTVKMYGQEGAMTEKYRRTLASQMGKNIKSRIVYGISESVGNISSLYAQVTAFLIGILFFLGDGCTVSDLVLTAGYVGIMGQAFSNITSFLKFVQPTLVAAERIRKIIDSPKEEDGTTTALPDLTQEDAICFDRVTFGYDSDAPVLKDVSFQIRKGETVALVGPSGVGKTTVFMLLLQFYKAQRGDIVLFGRNVRDLSLSVIRDLTSCVFQDSILFNASIFENIQWAKPDCTAEEVYDAAKKAQIHDFILSLPAGYDTVLANNGSALSGGQRQRLAIARAILKDAPILLLDEMTSAQDANTEQEVLDALREVKVDKTVLMIAHRESVLGGVDRILRFSPDKVTWE